MTDTTSTKMMGAASPAPQPPEQQPAAPASSSFRMRRAPRPEVGDAVMALVKHIDDEVGLSVELLEYDHISARIAPSEITNARRRPASLRKLVQANAQLAVVVVDIDDDRGYLELSLKRLTADERANSAAHFTKSKLVRTIVRVICKKLSVAAEEIYEQVVWPLEDRHGHCYDAFVAAERDPSVLYGLCGEQVEALLLQQIAVRLAPKPQLYRTSIVVTCDKKGGIESIRAALLTAMSEQPTPMLNPAIDEADSQVSAGGLAVQDKGKLGLASVHALTPEVISRQATINIGIVGHVAHGKSTLVEVLTGVSTQRFQNEKTRNITMKLGCKNTRNPTTTSRSRHL